MPPFGKKKVPENFASESVSQLLQAVSLDVALKHDKDLEKQSLEKCNWYHGAINRNLAEKRLKKGGKTNNGRFLIRESKAFPGDYVLSFVYNTDFVHFQVDQITVGSYSISQGPLFQGLDNLVDNYHRAANGLPTALQKGCKGEPAPVCSRGVGYNNLLHRAIAEGNSTTALPILKHPSCPDVNYKNETGSTPLHVSSKSGMTDVVMELLARGAIVCVKDQEGYTPLMQACMNNHAAVVKLLLVKGRCDPQDRNLDTGRVALHEAAERGNVDTVKVMLQLDVPGWPRDSSQRTPYELAVKQGHNNVAKLLDDHTASPAHLSRKEWYHSNLSRQDANSLLLKCGMSDGLFLVRNSSRHAGWFVLSMSFNLDPFQFEVHSEFDSAYFITDGPLFPTLEHLVEYYCVRRDGLPCRLVRAITPEGSVKLLTVPSLVDAISDGDPIYMESSTLGGASKQPNPPTTQSRPAQSLPLTQDKADKRDEDLQTIDPSKVDLGFELGQGEYGSVVKGTWTNPEGQPVDVAIKTFHSEHTNQIDSFMSEAKVMVKLDHPSIVKLIGISMGPPVMLIQELITLGSMLDFLWDYPEKIQVKKDLYLWAAQIASGMQYLETKGYVHRDLAARNILLASKKQAKVADFGLSRAISENSNYYVATTGGRWPIKWYAPESIMYGKFTSATDVWSYGVTLWEMFSLGDQPYGEMKGAEVLEMIERNARLEKPPRCPDKVYDIMLKCWSHDAADRPTFKKLLRDFKTDPEYEAVQLLVPGSEEV